ncbi:MAG TPA: hypothetical protein VNN80_04300 [Polyangiaceae bacterium]|jgi:hypothetical protein|nr:hypothetical protein [Polyangiaceae bacterium]
MSDLTPRAAKEASMTVPDLYTAVHWTARASAVLFALALWAPVLGLRRQQRPYLAFMVAHTVHFGFVVWLALVTGGARMFPGGRDIADAGGWPAVFGIFAFFYALASVGLLARHRGRDAGGALRLGGHLATTFLGYMYVSTYVGLVTRSPWYALPAALVGVAVLVDLAGSRRLRPPGEYSPGTSHR